MATRPKPPTWLFGFDAGDRFVPAPEVEEWMTATFIAEDGPLHNPQHLHLIEARIGCLWTNVPNARNGRAIIGQCERGEPLAMGKWAKARARQQVEEWFGAVPDFILTFDAAYADTCHDLAWCALVEHELMHAAQDTDAFGMPRFNASTGRPAYTIRGHDIQEFVGIVRRYGADTPGIRDFVEAATQPPEIGMASIAHACGSCK